MTLTGKYLLTLGCVAIAWYATSVLRRNGSAAADPRPGSRDSAARNVLTARARDTVYVLRGSASRDTLLWVSQRAGVRTQHRIPQVVTRAQLLDYNRDGVLDLATFFEDEDLFATVFLGGPDRAERVFDRDENACFQPEFVDITGDGKLDIVEYIFAAVPHELCRLYTKHDNLCLPDLPTEWAVAWVQSADGHFRKDSTAAATFYREQARRYAQGAKQFRQHMATNSSVRESMCRSIDVNVMDWMAIRAANIARLGGR